MISDKAKGMSSKAHINHSYNTGEQGEALFAKVMKGRGIKFRSASDSDNKKRHVDFWVGEDDAQVGVDVKGLKSSHKKGYVVVEVKNVQGKDGWCAPSTAAGLIAFQFEDCFIVVPKDKLWDYIQPFIGDDAEVATSFSVENVHHKKYTRSGRKDLMTVISRKELERIQHLKYDFNGSVVDKKGETVGAQGRRDDSGQTETRDWNLSLG